MREPAPEGPPPERPPPAPSGAGREGDGGICTPAGSHDAALPPRPHPTRVREKGPFAFAECGCGWRGPARRARDRARTDAAGHP
ncbi:hypothetical protein E0L36_23990 [Streptomyces sp. AJS327]|uniref:hypothetical protein n=1 Tax=Streptomyces sp. AJS327 TaxID=2545265 RepID=UPI0015DDD32C|nr:hypothetical protein [Streptomyces sp. AJS327]MBA0053805.1 hypothetical protein [Streptomyces sp. AJS327]